MRIERPSPAKAEQVEPQEGAQTLRRQEGPQGPAGPNQTGLGETVWQNYDIPRPPELPPTPPPPPATGDVAAVLDQVLSPLADEVQQTPPPKDVPPSQPGDMTGLEENQLQEYFTVLFADVAKLLGFENAEQIPADIKESMREMLMQTHGLNLPLDPAITNAVKPSPELIAEVAKLIKDSLAPPKTKSSITTGSTPAAHENIEIPGPSIVALERGLKASAFDFATCDIETMVAVVMFQASEEADKDLREMLKQVDSRNKQKAAYREQMQAMKEQQAAAENKLRGEYDRRRKLEPDDEDFIPSSVSFDDYKAQRQLDFPLNADGVWDGSQGVGLGLDWPLFEAPAPTETTGDGASGTNEGEGGVDGAGGPDGTGGSVVATFVGQVLSAEDKALAAKYNLTEDQLKGIKNVYDTLANLFPEIKEKNATLEAFLESPRLPYDSLEIPRDALGLELNFLDDKNLGLKPGAGAAANIAQLNRLTGCLKRAITEDKMMRALETKFKEMTMYDMFANHLEDGTGGSAATSKPKLNAQLEVMRAEYSALLGAAKNMFGTDFALAWAEKKKTVFESVKTEITNEVVNRSQDPIIFRFALMAMTGREFDVPSDYRRQAQALAARLEGTAVAAFMKDALASGLTIHELGDLWSTDAADDRMARDYFASMADAGRVDGALTRDINDARQEHQTRRQEGMSTQFLGQLDAAVAAPVVPVMVANAVFVGAALASTVTPVADAALAPTTSPPPGPAPAAAPAPAPQIPPPLGEGAQGQIGKFSDFGLKLDEMKNNMDSLSELAEADSLRLQMYMDRRAKLHSTLSNLLKNMADTKSGIINNLK